MRRLGLSVGVLLLGLAAPARAQSISLTDLVGTWVGGPTDSASTVLPGMEASDTLVIRADSTYQWTRTTAGKTERYMYNRQNPADNRWKRFSNNRISWLGGAGYNLTLQGQQLTMVGAAKTRAGKIPYLAFKRIDAKPKP